MTITTYLMKDEINKPMNNREIADILKEVRKVTGVTWVVKEYKLETTRWFGAPKIKYLYTIFYPLYDNAIEHQVINFYKENSDTSFNTMVTADVAWAYLSGILAR